MPKPTRFDLYRKEQVARKKAASLIQKTAQAQLAACWRLLRPTVEQIKKAQVEAPVSPSDPAFWDQWIDDFARALNEALTTSADWIGQPVTDWYTARGYEGVVHDPGAFVQAYQDQIGARDGREIRDIGENTRTWVQDAIAQWFASDRGMDDLISTLWTEFTPYRARLIAITETTALSSAISYDVMRQIDLDKWTWDSRNDYLVCERCKEKHGQKFSLKDEPPPAHPGCRCGISAVDEGE